MGSFRGHRAGRGGRDAVLRRDLGLQLSRGAAGNLEGAIFGHSLKTYGWVYLIVAIVLLVCGFLVLTGSQLGRWVGIAAGAIGCISAIWWMPYYPIWSLTYIVIGALVIYALAAYGGEAEAA